MDVEHGDANGQARNFRTAPSAGFAVHQRNVCGSAAHIERDDSLEAAAAGHSSSADHATGGSGEQSAHRFARGRSESGDAPA